MSEDNPSDTSLSVESLTIKPEASPKPAEITKSSIYFFTFENQ